jgi:hypothetical protein
MSEQKINVGGISAAFATPIFLGMAPIFGKLAITAGADSFTVAAIRTMVAVALLWVVYGLFFRKYIFIYPAGLMGCNRHRCHQWHWITVLLWWLEFLGRLDGTTHQWLVFGICCAHLAH